MGFPTVWYGNGSGNGGPACEEYSACSASGKVDALPWLLCWKAWKPSEFGTDTIECMRVSGISWRCAAGRGLVESGLPFRLLEEGGGR